MKTEVEKALESLRLLVATYGGDKEQKAIALLREELERLTAQLSPGPPTAPRRNDETQKEPQDLHPGLFL